MFEQPNAEADSNDVVEMNVPSTLSKRQLKSIIERVERLNDEKREILEQIREVYAEAKGNGFDVKALRKVVAMRKKSAAERAEEDAMVETYMMAIGAA